MEGENSPLLMLLKAHTVSSTKKKDVPKNTKLMEHEPNEFCNRREDINYHIKLRAMGVI